MSASSVEFCFRVWVHPYLGDAPEIEVWYHGIEPTSPKRRYVGDWVQESLENEDFWELFDLDKEKYWQVVGKGTLRGYYDGFGEYDEEFDLIEYEKAEVPESYYDWLWSNNLTLEDNTENQDE